MKEIIKGYQPIQGNLDDSNPPQDGSGVISENKSKATSRIIYIIITINKTNS